MPTINDILAEWVLGFSLDQVPVAIVKSTVWRVLDIVGAMLAGRDTELVEHLCDAYPSVSSGIQLVGIADLHSTEEAALIMATMGCVLEFDDSHVATGIHASTPVVATALSLGSQNCINGHQLIEAVLVGNELACRLALAAPGVFHHQGLHPTAMVAAFGCTYAAAKIAGVTTTELRNAIGIAGSMAAGIMASWEDGTDAKSLHAGFAARAALQALHLARHQVTGPASVFEGRFGFFRSHIQTDPVDFNAITDELGERWEILNIASRPFPCGHYIQPYIDAALELQQRDKIKLEQIVSIQCPVPEYMIPLVCEPREEKLRPKTPWHARYSLQHCIAEALSTGGLDKYSCNPSALAEGRFSDLAAKVYGVPAGTNEPRTQWSGEVHVALHDGTTRRHRIAHLRGTPQNPMNQADIVKKFYRNADGVLTPEGIDHSVDVLLSLELSDNISTMLKTLSTLS